MIEPYVVAEVREELGQTDGTNIGGRPSLADLESRGITTGPNVIANRGLVYVDSAHEASCSAADLVTVVSDLRGVRVDGFPRYVPFGFAMNGVHEVADIDVTIRIEGLQTVSMGPKNAEAFQDLIADVPHANRVARSGAKYESGDMPREYVAGHLKPFTETDAISFATATLHPHIATAVAVVGGAWTPNLVAGASDALLDAVDSALFGSGFARIVATTTKAASAGAPVDVIVRPSAAMTYAGSADEPLVQRYVRHELAEETLGQDGTNLSCMQLPLRPRERAIFGFSRGFAGGMTEAVPYIYNGEVVFANPENASETDYGAHECESTFVSQDAFCSNLLNIRVLGLAMGTVSRELSGMITSSMFPVATTGLRTAIAGPYRISAGDTIAALVSSTPYVTLDVAESDLPTRCITTLVPLRILFKNAVLRAWRIRNLCRVMNEYDEDDGATAGAALPPFWQTPSSELARVLVDTLIEPLLRLVVGKATQSAGPGEAFDIDVRPYPGGGVYARCV